MRAYVRQERLPRRADPGLSGGIDSALVAAIACDALGPQNVYGVLDAVALLLRPLHGRRGGAGPAARGCNFRTVPIAPMFDAYDGGRSA